MQIKISNKTKTYASLKLEMIRQHMQISQHNVSKVYRLFHKD